MISCEGMDRNVVVHGVLKKQNGTAIIPQGKTQTGRTVWEQPVAMTVQTFDQQIVVASQRTTTHYLAEKRTPQNQEPVKSFRQQVLDAVEKLRRNRDSQPDVFLYCMEVIKEINKLKNNKYLLHDHDKSSANYRFMISQLANIYEIALGPALGVLKSRANDGYLWIYKFDLNMMAQTFRKMIPKNAVFKAILSELYQKHFNQELGDMEYLIEFLPEEKAFFDHISEGISYLMDETSPVCYIPLLDNHTLEGFKKRQEKLLQDAKSHMKDGAARKDQEELDKSRKTVPKATTETWNKRKHHEQLFEKFREIMPEKQDEGNKRDRMGIHFLEKITELCNQYDTLIGESHTKLRRSLVGVTSVSAKLVLLEIQDTDTTDQVRMQSLKAIGHLSNRGWLQKGCNDLYINYLKPQQAGTSTKITYFDFNLRMDHIYTLLENSGENDCIMLALEKLKEIRQYEQHLPEIDTDNMLRNRIRNAKNKCAQLLFYPILDSYRELLDFSSPDEESSKREAYTKMRQYKSDFVKLNPYKFILTSNEAVKAWERRAFAAWHDDIDRLRNATSFSEKDINDLLQLKDIAPDAPNQEIFNNLQAALTNIFQLALKNDTGSVSIEEEVAKLSEWVDLLSKDIDIHQKLRECNEEWKKKYYKGTICDRTMTSSNTSTKTPPVFVHPGIVDVPLSTDGCHSRTERQITPDMQPVTAPLHMPALAINQPFQHPVLSPSCTATNQPSAEIRPQPGQLLQAYHEASTTGQIPGAPMTLHFPMHSYPQPAPPHMPEPTTQQPFQQSVSTPYYTVTEQTPVGIRLQPGQPLQLQPLSAYHEVPTTGQLPGAPMTSHFPVNPYAPQLLVYEQPQPKWQPVYQQPYENQSTISSEPRANHSFSSNTQ